MSKIWKFELGEPNAPVEYKVDIPTGSMPLSVEIQNGKLCVYVAVNVPAASTELTEHTFHSVGTGMFIPDVENLMFLDSVTDRTYVWHIFWEGVQ